MGRVTLEGLEVPGVMPDGWFLAALAWLLTDGRWKVAMIGYVIFMWVAVPVTWFLGKHEEFTTTADREDG